MSNHYETLNLQPGASQEEIKLAYQKLSKKFNPENNQEDKYFETMFRGIQEAYDALSNEEKRVINDEKYNLNPKATAPSPTGGVNRSPEIILFESDKDSFEEGESIRLSWKTTNVDDVIIKPFGTVDKSGTKVFKLKNYDKETLSITLQAINNSFGETITKTITLKNNIIEFDFGTIQENEEVEAPEKLQDKLEIPQPVREEPKVHANSFASPIAKPIIKSTESFFSSDGRLRRGDYLVRALLLAIPAGISYVISDTSYDNSTIIISGILMLIVGVLSIIQFIKRLHDINLSGWLSLVTLIPVLGGIFGFIVLFIDGSKGPNQYGEDPKGRG